MTEQDLKNKIEKKQTQIEKIQKRINKLESKKSEKSFCQEYAPFLTQDWKNITTFDQLKELRNEIFPNDDAESWVARVYREHVDDIDRDIRRSNKEIQECQKIIDKYSSQLSDKEAKSATKRVPVIDEFLANWKQLAKEYVIENVREVKEYYRINSEYSNWFNTTRRTLPREEAREQDLEYRRLQREAQEKIHPWTSRAYRGGKIDEAELNKILDKEVENKYWNLVNKVKDTVGEITDASDLRIAGDGNLNGIVIGTQGKAEVSTILAGGYNQGIIVNVKHGQILHYRVLVKKIK